MQGEGSAKWLKTVLSGGLWIMWIVWITIQNMSQILVYQQEEIHIHDGDKSPRRLWILWKTIF